jgi:hypothetical protein
MMANAVCYPTLTLVCCCTASALLTSALRRRRLFQEIGALIFAIAAASVFWCEMDVWFVIPAAMLVLCGGIGLAVGWRLTADVPLRTRAVRICVGSMAAILPCFGFLFFLSPFRMWDETMATSTSPDGVYIATLYYKDGLTFGFQHVTVDRSGWHLFGGHAELAELACEGVAGLSWRDSHTLFVDYDGTKHPNRDYDTEFVSRQSRWRDVQVIYRDVRH